MLKIIIIFALSLQISEPKNQKEYIQKYAPYAMILHKLTGVPASIPLAQALYESGGGISNIAKNSNNQFGMRYYKELFNGEYYQSKSGKWRKYKTILHSYIDHNLFLCRFYGSGRYKSYKYWGGFLGYGGKNYWKNIIKIIEQKNLNYYDYATI